MAVVCWVNREFLKPLIALGGWMSIANVIGPLLVYMDLFLIGRVIPNALHGVLFPASSTAPVSDPYGAKRMF